MGHLETENIQQQFDEIKAAFSDWYTRCDSFSRQDISDLSIKMNSAGKALAEIIHSLQPELKVLFTAGRAVVDARRYPVQVLGHSLPVHRRLEPYSKLVLNHANIGRDRFESVGNKTLHYHIGASALSEALYIEGNLSLVDCVEPEVDEPTNTPK